MRPMLALCLLMTACGGAPAEWTATATGGASDAPEPAQEARVHLADDVTPVDFTCSEGATESCDGVDNDCDGEIDDGCGWATGPVQVTLAWSSGADLDLVVIGSDLSTGTVDKSGRGACEEAEYGTIENATFETAPPGTYAVNVVRADACEHDGPTTVSVSIAHAGRVLGTYNRTLAPELAEAEILRLTVP